MISSESMADLSFDLHFVKQKQLFTKISIQRDRVHLPVETYIRM